MSSIKLRFETDTAAVTALEAAGFSVGHRQLSDPRGIMFGDYDIQKWRNLNQKDKDGLDGHLVRHGPPDSPTSVYLHSAAHIPASALSAVQSASTPLDE